MPKDTRTIGVQLLDELHKRVGICGHCGKKTCAGKAQYSILPDRLKKDDVLAAIREVTGEPL